jgi:hypothetical protein|tara:strand:+ start:36 stop:464 length:429 start_codon:yes stop_codon:yes gene_type:complete
VDRREQLKASGARVVTPEAARELISSHFDVSPYEQIERLRGAGLRKAKAEGVCTQLEHQRHIMLATIANELAVAHSKEKLSEAKLDRMARADQRYRAHIAGLGAAVEERDTARSEYAAQRATMEWDRAAISHLNALSRLDGA